MRVTMPSTTANYFHLLRTHMRIPFRKPCINVAPKKLLKLKTAASTMEEMGFGTRFLTLINDKDEKLVAPSKVRRVILCSGQVYYELEAKRQKEGHHDVAIMRVESLCPWPFKEIIAEFKNYSNAECVWVQEEPKNAGVWAYAEPRLRNIREFMGQDEEVKYVGRPMMAAVSTGYTK